MPKILNNTPLIEGNVAYQEDIAIEEEENDIAPLVKSLRGILRPFDERSIETKKSEYTESLSVNEQEEDSDADIAPNIKSLRAILRPYEMTGEYDDELCRLILKKHS
ncbi:hypothetical protein [Capnocytophaga leadbetteri]|uniref:hypothetical protein n=1 Tax=Capnocytophaga leadbetteri TaxID=327575 RepID=UPI0026EF23B4|nr:hypothetical protein [Capnocytophaga leadbetteri]